ncbi:hypothetical protein [Pseudoclavibacter sp. CFCC 13611]|uniref:hypothetical protein n=1 Tax=Pseudoclavibacter sp. CFCC 13611 TaxID=2615178 RepID=UPI00130190F8|nr:hypothetical protein [Pseudoclavibacter sp. CFCC 13611]KAB1662829.1 hypothetical protein F8O08_09705 [Pseudoclavibacter sp. CFCC 13611]
MTNEAEKNPGAARAAGAPTPKTGAEIETPREGNNPMTTVYRSVELVPEEISAHYSSLLKSARRAYAQLNGDFRPNSLERAELEEALTNAGMGFTDGEPPVAALRKAYRQYVWTPLDTTQPWIGDLPAWAEQADVSFDIVGGEATVVFWYGRGTGIETSQSLSFHVGTGVVTDKGEMTTWVHHDDRDGEMTTADLHNLVDALTDHLERIDQEDAPTTRVRRSTDYCAEPQHDGIGGGL